jgi:hypothetical protein
MRYAGTPCGGVWKTTHGAKTFEPVFDDQPMQAIGAVAVEPSDPKVVWAGSCLRAGARLCHGVSPGS